MISILPYQQTGIIDITPYQQKLEALREYMGFKIEHQPFDIWMDLQVCPNEYYIVNKLPLPNPYKKTIRLCPETFEEWYETKTQSLKTNTV